MSHVLMPVVIYCERRSAGCDSVLLAAPGSWLEHHDDGTHTWWPTEQARREGSHTHAANNGGSDATS